MNLEAALYALRQTIRLKHLSLATEESYVGWVLRYAAFLKEHRPGAGVERKLEIFLTHLARQGVAASTQNQAFCALLFFYRNALKMELGPVDALRAKKPARIRHAPQADEIRSLLAAVRDLGGYPTRLIVHLLYGCGLRVCEPLNLRIKDVVLTQSRIILRSAKGGKDRVVAIPCSLAADLSGQLALAKAVAARDRGAGLPVALPGRLAAKYPHLRFSPKWAWLFPSHQPCADPRTGLLVRWRCHEANVQRAVRIAARPLELDITPHHLRHAYATHCLEHGGNPRAIQQAMGHSSLETTMGYLHAEALSVASPLEVL